MADARVVRADSVTAFGAEASGSVLVTGSHAGRLVGEWALSVGACGLIANDAGVGKEAAGVGGLDRLDEVGVPAAAVDVWSARIGDGDDTWQCGAVSAINEAAARLGVVSAMSAVEAARLMARANLRASSGPIGLDLLASSNGVVLDDGEVAVVALDSAGWIDARHTGAIVVTGSHGGVVAGRAVKASVAAAVFNDAGIGKQRSGVGRLALLDEMGIAGFTVAHQSARIGEALETFESGDVSCVNETATRCGVAIGTSARTAIEQIRVATKENRAR